MCQHPGVIAVGVDSDRAIRLVVGVAGRLARQRRKHYRASQRLGG
jgi:hypothetical protein